MHCCASIATVVTRTCHTVSLYVSRLSCSSVLLLTLRSPKWSLSPQVFLYVFCASIVSPMRVTILLNGILFDVIIMTLFSEKNYIASNCAVFCKFYCFHAFLLASCSRTPALCMCIISPRVTDRFFSQILLISFFSFNMFIVIRVRTIPLPRLLSAASDSLPYHVPKPLLLRKIPVGKSRLT